jgi:hypothetical protein
MNQIQRFEPNVPVEVALAYGQGKTVDNGFGRRVMFTLVSNRVMFLGVTVADRIERLGVKARQPFFLCRYQPRRGALDQWRAWLPGHEPSFGEQPDGTFVVPSLGGVDAR